MKLISPGAHFPYAEKPAVWKVEEEDLVPFFLCQTFEEGFQCSYEPAYAVMTLKGHGLEGLCDEHIDPRLVK